MSKLGDEQLEKLQSVASSRSIRKEAHVVKIGGLVVGCLLFFVLRWMGFSRDACLVVAAMYLCYVLISYNLILMTRSIESIKKFKEVD